MKVAILGLCLLSAVAATAAAGSPARTLDTGRPTRELPAGTTGVAVRVLSGLVAELPAPQWLCSGRLMAKHIQKNNSTDIEDVEDDGPVGPDTRSHGPFFTVGY